MHVVVPHVTDGHFLSDASQQDTGPCRHIPQHCSSPHPTRGTARLQALESVRPDRYWTTGLFRQRTVQAEYMAHDMGVNDFRAAPRVPITWPPNTKTTSQDITIQATRIRCASTGTMLFTEAQKLTDIGGGGGSSCQSVLKGTCQ